MSEKEILKEAIGRTLIPEYHQLMEEASDNHEFSLGFQKRMDKLIRRRRKPTTVSSTRLESVWL